VVDAPHAIGDLIAASLDDFAPAAIEDLAPLPLPPGGLWDPTYPPPPEPPPAPVHWRVFFMSAAQRDDAARALVAAYPDVRVESEDVPDEDWAARTQRELTAIAAGAFVVAPPWDVPSAVPPGTFVIVIEPSRGFGTGHHASTRLCLRALSDLDVAGQPVVDLGTGSGVLAVAAALKGARDVLAVDVDEDAIEAARESAALNPAAGAIRWTAGDFRDANWVTAHGGPWPVVLANLTGGMLIASAARVREIIAPGGILVASGFDESERAAVQQALGLRERMSLVEDGWVGLVLAR
jgi:ribosomal protein L11 methyltransferase